jgi:hypothetical protein
MVVILTQNMGSKINAILIFCKAPEVVWFDLDVTYLSDTQLGSCVAELLDSLKFHL